MKPATLAAALFCLGFVCPAASAISVTAQILDAAGQPVTDAAVYAEPVSGQVLPKLTRAMQIEQVGRKFSPLVSVIQTDSEISFPNNDSVRHHVYSFSPAKVFELKLYSGVPAAPVRFDKPGTVVIGCNIHDHMVAYIHVVNTPYYGKTDSAGKIRIDGLAAGKYRLRAWHFGMPAGAPIPEQAITVGGSDINASFTLNTRPGATGH
ncbi:MAG: methylamine utilization protein [Pseudomonadota bacterium]